MSVEDIAKPKQCRFRDMVYSMTEETISEVDVHVSPGSAETLRWDNKSPFDTILSQEHLSQKLPKSVDVRRSYSAKYQCRFFRHSVYIHTSQR